MRPGPEIRWRVDDARPQTDPVSDEPRLIDLTPDDLPRIQELEDTVWFEVQPGVTAQDLADRLDFRHARAAERAVDPLPGEPALDRPPLVGIYSAYDLTVSVPGRGGAITRLPMDGLTWVGVHPDARRRGLLTRLMRDHLHRVHDRGEAAIAGLMASETGIYGRFGYGCASLDVKLELGRGTELKAPAWVAQEADEVLTHVVTLPTPEGMAALHEAHLACAATTLGAVTRPGAMAGTWFRDFPKARGAKEPRRLLLARRDGQLSGYAVFRREAKWEDGSPQGEVSVGELGAVDLPSLLALARRLLDLDLTTKVTFWARRLDDPLLWWTGGPRAAGPRIYDSLWIRPVDLPRALTDRGYAAPCDLVLQVEDELCPWNAGRWRLTTDPSGTATCERTEDEPDLEVPVAALGAAYLGGRALASMVPALHGRELRPGAVGELSRALRADVDPVGTIDF